MSRIRLQVQMRTVTHTAVEETETASIVCECRKTATSRYGLALAHKGSMKVIPAVVEIPRQDR